MKILYVCADPGIPVRGHKGAAVHVRAMAGAFAALGHEVTLVTPRPGPADGPAPRARLVEVPAPDMAGEPAPEAREQAAIATAAAAHGAAQALLARERYDLIYERYSLWSDAGARLAHESGLPLVVEFNAPLRLEAARYRSLHDAARAAEIEQRMLLAAGAVAVVSDVLRDYVIERGVWPTRAHVVPNAVDEEWFHPAQDGDAARARLGLEARFVIGFVGTARPWHDLDTLMDAVARLRAETRSPGGMPYHLLLVGTFPPAVHAALAGRGLDGDTTIVGPVPHHEVPEYLAAMHVAVSPHPALLDFYFSPLKLCEYMACGVATVAADVAPVREVITGGLNGLLYPPGDAAALAAHIAALASDARSRKRLAWHGAAHVLQKHTWKGNARQVLEWTVAPPLSLPPAERVGGATDTPVPIFDGGLRRHLYAATRADLAGPLLAARLEGAGGVARLKILKYKPRRRCVIAYELDGRSTGVIGKVFRDERGARLFALQQALWSDGFGPHAADGIGVAEPLAYVPRMRLLAQALAPGRTLDEFVGTPEFAERVRFSAAVIAKLHASHVYPEGTYTLDAELENLARFAADLRAWRPDHGTAFARQHARLRAYAAVLPPAEAVPAHRDFYYSQVLYAGTRATLIDLDLFALADPAIDVANFAAHLRFLALQRQPDPHAFDAPAQAFVDEYVRQRGPALGDPAQFAARLAFYEAATYFRLLHVVLQRPQLAHCFDALRALAEDGVHVRPMPWHEGA